jgi:ABC-type transporter Mla subunit MlaD
VRPLVAALLAASLLLAGCGGDKKSSSGEEAAASWADDLCSSFVDWQGSLQSAAGKFRSGQASQIQEAAHDVSDATKKLGNELRSLGKPPSTGGAEKAKSAVNELSDGLKANVDKIQQALTGLSNAQGISNAVSTIGAAVSAMGDEFSSTTTELKSLSADEPWRKAFESSDACQKLAGR